VKNALALWTAFVLVLLLFDPGFIPPLPCGRLVGPNAECEAAQALANEAAWWLHTLPLIASIAAGYIAIILVATRGRRRATSRQVIDADALQAATKLGVQVLRACERTTPTRTRGRGASHLTERRSDADSQPTTTKRRDP